MRPEHNHILDQALLLKSGFLSINQAGDPEIKQEILLNAVRFQDPQALAFVDEVGSLFKNACAQGGKLRAGKIRPATALRRRRGFYRKLDTICVRPLMDQKALALQHRLTDADKDKPRLFTFLKHPHLQPTNNQAERSLRGMAIFRKICMGTPPAAVPTSIAFCPVFC